MPGVPLVERGFARGASAPEFVIESKSLMPMQNSNLFLPARPLRKAAQGRSVLAGLLAAAVLLAGWTRPAPAQQEQEDSKPEEPPPPPAPLLVVHVSAL